MGEDAGPGTNPFWQCFCPESTITDGSADAQIWVMPGAAVAVYGCGFGRTPGRVVLKLPSANREYDLQIVEWHDDKVLGTVPLGISGVLDQAATLQSSLPASRRARHMAHHVPGEEGFRIPHG